MRLICPNCDAQYEVPDDVIPETGRDVQCSNCGHTWFEGPEAESEPAPPPIEEPVAEPDVIEDGEAETPIASVEETEAPIVAQEDETDEELLYSFDDPDDEEQELAPPPISAPRRPRRTIDPEIASILQEEADRAEERRRHDDQDPMESQPDLGLEVPSDPEARRAEEARRRMSLLKGEPEVNESSARSDRLPDIEEINSTLRSTSDRTGDFDDAGPTEAVVAKQRSGFRTGFLGVVLGTCIAAGVYIFSEQIGTMVPQLSPSMEQYSAWVDAKRVAFDSWVRDFIVPSEDAQ